MTFFRPSAYLFQGFIPRSLPKCPLLLDERLCKPVGAVDIIEPEPAFDAGPAFVHAEVPVRGNLEHLVVFHIEDQGAPNPAIGADRRDLLHLPIPALEAADLFTQSSYRTDADTVTAENARGLLHGPIEGGRDLRVKPALGVIDCLAVLQLITDGHTPSAEDTFVVVPFEKGIGCPDRVVVFLSHKSWFSDTQLIGVFFELAGAALLARHAVVRMIGEQKLDDQFPGIQHPLRIGANDHLVGHGVGAGSHQGSRPFHLHHAHPAGRGRRQVFPVTEVGNLDPRLPGRLENGRPLFSLNFTAIDT